MATAINQDLRAFIRARAADLQRDNVDRLSRGEVPQRDFIALFYVRTEDYEVIGDVLPLRPIDVDADVRAAQDRLAELVMIETDARSRVPPQLASYVDAKRRELREFNAELRRDGQPVVHGYVVQFVVRADLDEPQLYCTTRFVRVNAMQADVMQAQNDLASVAADRALRVPRGRF